MDNKNYFEVFNKRKLYKHYKPPEGPDKGWQNFQKSPLSPNRSNSHISRSKADPSCKICHGSGILNNDDVDDCWCVRAFLRKSDNKEIKGTFDKTINPFAKKKVINPEPPDSWIERFKLLDLD